eukprot:4066425-Pyramimonas_sp.AAC.1
MRGTPGAATAPPQRWPRRLPRARGTPAQANPSGLSTDLSTAFRTSCDTFVSFSVIRSSWVSSVAGKSTNPRSSTSSGPP